MFLILEYLRLYDNDMSCLCLASAAIGVVVFSPNCVNFISQSIMIIYLCTKSWYMYKDDGLACTLPVPGMYLVKDSP